LLVLATALHFIQKFSKNILMDFEKLSIIYSVLMAVFHMNIGYLAVVQLQGV